METFSYYTISGTYKQTDVPMGKPQDMINHIEHFSSGDDEAEDKLLMVYKTTNVQIIQPEEAKKLIEKYL